MFVLLSLLDPESVTIKFDLIMQKHAHATVAWLRCPLWMYNTYIIIQTGALLGLSIFVPVNASGRLLILKAPV